MNSSARLLTAKRFHGKEKAMSNENNNRVLSRMGARQLTQNEIDRIGGGVIPTRLTAILTAPVTDPDRRLDE
jgi:hypothetical protein